MRIRWENLIPLLVVVLIIVLLVKLRPFFKNLFEAINEPHYYHGPDREVLKILIIGIICFTVLGTAKFLSKK
ncbi:MAG: hypothetical protein A2Y10_08325 [Planctomycetes bacterium GWF2_41_51]|nr:MAG: hypothetical protein A2Y10_08325 [Planctomycetes bacterium GWF2_41_51]HBG25844.1 hypothetical protein [Phycisphaerales bacterium]